jgi:hypothetical protein
MAGQGLPHRKQRGALLGQLTGSVAARLGILNPGQEIRSHASERERTTTALAARCPPEKAGTCS